MCGIFGIIATDIPKRHSAEVFKFLSCLAEESKARGTDATGFAAVADGKFITDKHPLISSHFVKRTFQWNKIRGAKDLVLIGHTRASSVGSPLDNNNNHPFHGKRYSLVHNGSIWCHEYVAHHNGFSLSTDCDSELILHFLEREENIRDGILNAYCELDSYGDMAVSVLERRTRKVHLFRTLGRPCYVFHIARWNATIFCSTPTIFNRAAFNVFGSVDRLEGNCLKSFNEDIPPYTHLLLGPNGAIEYESLDKDITEKTGETERGKYQFTSHAAKNRATTEGGKSGATDYNKTTVLCQHCQKDLYYECACLCPECFEALALCKCYNSYYRTMQAAGTRDDGEGLIDVESDKLLSILTNILPENINTDGYVPQELLKSTGVYNEENIWNLPSQEDWDEFMEFEEMGDAESIEWWKDMNSWRLDKMSHGEFIAYFRFVRKVVEQLEGINI